MKVYLDNNILVDIEEETYHLSQFLAIPNIEYFFSETHMAELINGLALHPELKDIRIQTIDRLCGNNYITPQLGPFKGGIIKESPREIFDLSMRFRGMHDRLFQMSNAMKINREAFLNEVKMNKLEVGNYHPTEIFGVLDNKLKEFWGYGIEVYLQKSLASTGRGVFSALFNLLDFFCYWHDKNGAARLYDSSHAYFAQFCDVLVSNDKRMRIKTVAVYDYLGINKKVYSADIFLKEYAADN